MWPSKEFTQEFTQHSHQENYIIFVFPHSCHAKRILIWWNTWVLLLVVSLFVLPLTSQASNITEGGNSTSDKHNEAKHISWPKHYQSRRPALPASPHLSLSISLTLFSHTPVSLCVSLTYVLPLQTETVAYDRGETWPVAWVPMWKWKRREKLWQEEPAEWSRTLTSHTAKVQWKEHIFIMSMNLKGRND